MRDAPHHVGCTGKRRYESWAVAARMARRTRRQAHAPLVPYHCRFCGGYHVGSEMARQHGKQRRRPRS